MSRQAIAVAALNTPVEALETQGPGNFQSKVDISNMVAGDELVIRGYQKVGAPGNPALPFATVRINYDLDIAGNADADTMFVPLPWTVEADEYIGVELTLTTATDPLPRTFNVSMTNLATFA